MSRFGHSSNKAASASENHNAPHHLDCSFRKKSRFLLIIGFSVLAIFFTLSFAISAYLNRPPGLIQDCDTTGFKNGDGPVMPDKGYKDGFYTFLLLGTDKDGYHTDTIMVVSLDTAGHKANIVSVPRDT